MKITLSEKNFVVILFVIVVFTFSFAQKDSESIEKLYFKTQGSNPRPSSILAENNFKIPQQKRILEAKNNSGANRKSIN